MVAVAKTRQKQATLKPTYLDMVIKDEYTDLEVTIEGSDHLYGSII